MDVEIKFFLRERLLLLFADVVYEALAHSERGLLVDVVCDRAERLDIHPNRNFFVVEVLNRSRHPGHVGKVSVLLAIVVVDFPCHDFYVIALFKRIHLEFRIPKPPKPLYNGRVV